jgi:hypothetical protein
MTVMRWFRKAYVWAMNVKLFMALYFVVMAFAAGMVELLTGHDSLKLVTLLEMLLVCAVIGLLQSLLLSEGADYGRGVFFGRSVLWLALSTAAAMGAAVLFGWFSGYPALSVVAFGAFLLFALILTLLGVKYEQDTDTVRLNEGLRRFKEKK